MGELHVTAARVKTQKARKICSCRRWR